MSGVFPDCSFPSVLSLSPRTHNAVISGLAGLFAMGMSCLTLGHFDYRLASISTCHLLMDPGDLNSRTCG